MVLSAGTPLASEAERVPARVHRLGVEAAAPVGDLHDELVAIGGQRDGGRRRAGVAGDIGQRLLHDPENGSFQVARQTRGRH